MFCQLPKQDKCHPGQAKVESRGTKGRKHFYIPFLWQILATISLDYHLNCKEAVEPFRSPCLPHILATVTAGLLLSSIR